MSLSTYSSRLEFFLRTLDASDRMRRLSLRISDNWYSVVRSASVFLDAGRRIAHRESVIIASESVSLTPGQYGNCPSARVTCSFGSIPVSSLIAMIVL